MMDRREALKRTALIMGSAVTSSVAMGILNGCKPKPGITWTPTFFTEDQAILITQLSDIIIPKTDTPGAKEVGVPSFIEEMVRDVYDEKDLDRFMSGLETFTRDAESEIGSPFIEADAEEQVNFANQEHSNAVAQNKDSGGEYSFILMVKELTVVGFFTSQVGAEEVLQYRQNPGAYHGCISLEEAGGKTWAT